MGQQLLKHPLPGRSPALRRRQTLGVFLAQTKRKLSSGDTRIAGRIVLHFLRHEALLAGHRAGFFAAIPVPNALQCGQCHLFVVLINSSFMSIVIVAAVAAIVVGALATLLAPIALAAVQASGKRQLAIA